MADKKHEEKCMAGKNWQLTDEKNALSVTP
jgi:hypothetical protein